MAPIRGKYARKGKTTKSSKKSINKAIRSVKVSNFNMAVEKVISRKAETKYVNYDSWNNIYGSTSLDFTTGVGGVFNITPAATTSQGTIYTIGQGVGQGDRVGNEILPVSLKLRLVIRANTFYDSVTNYNPSPLYVTMWVVKIRQHLTDSYSSLSTIFQNTFFQDGDISKGFNGTITDLVQEVNSNEIQLVMRKQWLVGNAIYQSGFGVNAPSAANQSYANNDASLCKMVRLNMSKYLPAKMIYNDGSDTPTNSRKLWCFFTCHRSDGNSIQTSAGNVTGPQPADVAFGAEFGYKDI